MVVKELSAQQYAELRANANPPVLIDVREPWEFALAHIEGALLKPMGAFYEWVSDLDKNASYVVVCHHGARSEMVGAAMLRMGFANVLNLSGGTDAWSRKVDANAPRY